MSDVHRANLPPEAKKVFQGKMFSVYQWPQQMYDGRTATFERILRPDSAGVIAVTPEGKIIITRQEQPTLQPFIGLLGGIVDPGETAIEAAKRELKEEGGFESNDWSEWFSVTPHSKIVWTVNVFVARGVQKVAEQKLDGGEKIELMEVSFEEFLQVTQDEKFRDTEITFRVLQALVDPAKMVEMKQLFFGN